MNHLSFAFVLHFDEVKPYFQFDMCLYNEKIYWYISVPRFTLGTVGTLKVIQTLTEMYINYKNGLWSNLMFNSDSQNWRLKRFEN